MDFIISQYVHLYIQIGWKSFSYDVFYDIGWVFDTSLSSLYSSAQFLPLDFP